MTEEWKDIEGYENLYQVSNLGRVKSLNFKRSGKEKIMKSHVNKVGYVAISLYKSGKDKIHTVHRLVAKHFIPNPDNLPQVDHINTNRTDNRVENLKWCTNEENSNNTITKEHMSEGQKGKYGANSNRSKVILQYDLNGNFIAKWYGALEIERVLGFKTKHISDVCLGRRKTCHGYMWKYAS